MHTFRRKSNGTYEIGQWYTLKHEEHEEQEFDVILMTDTLNYAVQMVNILNGGRWDATMAMDIHERITEPPLKIDSRDR